MRHLAVSLRIFVTTSPCSNICAAIILGHYVTLYSAYAHVIYHVILIERLIVIACVFNWNI